MPTLRRLVDTTGPDFYPTPVWATKALLHYETFPGILIEPCAGEHDLANVLREAGYDPECSDLYDYGMGDRICHFKRASGNSCITNPPFNQAEELIEHLLTCCDKFALLLRLAFLETAGRYEKFYKNNTLARVWVFSQRLSLYPKGATGKLEGGTVSHAWFVWDKARTNHETTLHFIAPGFKPGSKNVFRKSRADKEESSTETAPESG